MSATLWQSFRDDLYATFHAHNAEVVQKPANGDGASQRGVWAGGVEDACTFVALVAESHLFALRHDLTEVRKRYQQEALGFLEIEGTQHLI